MTIYDCECDQSLWLSVKINDQYILVGYIYRSPSADKVQSTNIFINMFAQIDPIKYNKIIITGDFDYPEINWEEGSCKKPCESKFIECIQDVYLTQPVKKNN